MRHRRSGRKLGKTAAHRRAMLANMVTSLFERERIETTIPKAKEARSLAERIITVARRGNAAATAGAKEKQLAARRYVARIVKDPVVLRKLFDEIAPRFVERPGGYTRILRLGRSRVGDSADLALLELLKKDEEPRKKKKKSRKTYRKIEAAAAATSEARSAKARARVSQQAKGEESAGADTRETTGEAPSAEEPGEARETKETREAAPKKSKSSGEAAKSKKAGK